MMQAQLKMPLADTLDDVTGSVLRCFAQCNHVTMPYDHWLLSDVLPLSVVQDITDLPFAPPEAAIFSGRRETNNASRIYFTQENQRQYPVCALVADAFNSPVVKAELSNLTGADLSAGHLRIEYCQDEDGFWLEPHLDIGVKFFTMLVYLSDDPTLRDAGTDIYDDTPEHNLVTSVPYEPNRGLIFIPSNKTWHGFTKRPIRGLRRSLIINYVSDAWRDKWELAY